MLQLKRITKTYTTGDFTQHALNDVSLSFRDCEFVSILGHSGSGKTTLLNIIGGLDQYTSGDLVINGVSTKKYKDRDWDIYRNHSVGFVFQSYNLIPHQTILQNVELALTLSGVNKKERARRAAEALEKVGLGDQLKKRPNQLSGGQMQRVAIARALINNPVILLADEPTGALDSDTSLQVMELLKEISRDRLVVMVTHNPELAEQYSTRIVRLVDGSITDDTNPFDGKEAAVKPQGEKAKKSRLKGRSMSFATAFSLSLNNLMTKKLRTFMTSFAGSIGIMGIALILSVSSGFSNYIDRIQEDTLSTYPLTITSETADMTSMMASAASAAEEIENGKRDVTEHQMIAGMFAQIGSNDIAAFKEYFEQNGGYLAEGINSVRYGYDLAPQIYSSDVANGALKVNPSEMFSSLMGSAATMYTGTGVFQEMIDNRELLDEQYSVLYGRWPEKYDELLLVLSNEGAISDYTVYALGLRDQSELEDMVEKVMNGEEVELEGKPLEWDYKDFLELTFSLVPASEYYNYNEEYGVYEDMSDDEGYMRDLVITGDRLRIVGVVAPKEGVSASALTPGVAYTSALTDRVIETAKAETIVKKQLADDKTDVFTGRSFEDLENDEEGEGLDFNDMISIDTNMLSSAFGMNVSEESMTALMSGYVGEISKSITADTGPAAKAFTDGLTALFTGALTDFVNTHTDTALGYAPLKVSDIGAVVTAHMSSAPAQRRLAALESAYVVPASAFSQTYNQIINQMLSAYVTNALTAMGLDPATDALPITAVGNPPVTIGVPDIVSACTANPIVAQAAAEMGRGMTEAVMQKSIHTKVSEMSGALIKTMSEAFKVDEAKIAGAFNFNLDEDELSRLMKAYMSPTEDASFEGNLKKLGWADKAQPSSMSIYLKDFDGKEAFLDFLDGYNEKMESEEKDEFVINYTDVTGLLMSSVKTIVDSVSYVLIAFVAISLVVSSIMIGVITLISVLERTKEIGILRAVGASKRDISRVFNAETFIVGLCAGFIGIGGTLLLLVPINELLHSLTGVASLKAVLPAGSAAVLIAISVALTFISGLLPSRAAARKNPVEALRTE